MSMVFSPNSEAFIERLRLRMASSAVTPSALRNMGKDGMAEHARKFLRKIDLKELKKAGAVGFPALLDQLTVAMRRHLKSYLHEGHSGWGPARKLLNLYFRDCFYNIYLRNAYHLKFLETVLEIPLDKYTGEYLREQPEGRSLPRWCGVSKLDNEISAQFQAVACKVAKVLNTSPVHLDVDAWRRDVL